jgi:hypothetical protein
MKKRTVPSKIQSCTFHNKLKVQCKIEVSNRPKTTLIKMKNQPCFYSTFDLEII